MNTSDQDDIIYLIRHAQSEYNVFEHDALSRGVDMLDFKFSEELFDCGITEFGVKQCEAAAEILKDVNIKVVFTSPLRRAIATATEIFKNHKNKPRIVVLPMLREILESSCDIPEDLEKIKKLFPHVDFSEMDKFQDKDTWILETIMDPQAKEELVNGALEFCKDKEDKGKAFRSFLAKKMKDSWPRVFEFGYDLVNRASKAKKEIRERMMELKPGEKVAVVSHSAYLRRFYGSKFDEIGCPFDDYGFKNCEVKEYKLP